MRPFPDAAYAVAEVVDADSIPGLSVGLQRPNSGVPNSLPFAMIYRYAGGDDGITDTARIAIDVFTTDYTDGRDKSERIRQLLTSGHHVTESAVVDRVTTDSAPVEVPYGDARIVRWTASYRVTLRRLPAL